MTSKLDGLISANMNAVAEYHSCVFMRNYIPKGALLFICEDVSKINIFDSNIQEGKYNSSVVKASFSNLSFPEYYLCAIGCMISHNRNKPIYQLNLSFSFLVCYDFN